jgi:phospholipid-translocating ATPase
MIPVFTFVLDCDVDENLALLYPELYKELTLEKTLSYRTFGVWVMVSIYQGTNRPCLSTDLSGCAIMILSNVLVGITEDQQQHLISVSFTALVLNELIMIALEIHTWHHYMIWAEVLTFACYFLSIPFLWDYFGNPFPLRLAF